MTPIELVIFDCDGVLIDSEAISCRVDAAYLTETGFPISAEEIMERYVGISAATMLADVEGRYGRRLPEDFGEILHRRIAAAFETELVAMAGIEGVLGDLGCASCVASSSAPERLRHSLGVVGLLPRFEPHIFSASQVPRGKPAPDLFLFAADQMGVAPESCLVIEDSSAGVRAAVAAGMTVFGFTGGGHVGPGHEQRLRQAGATAVFAHMSELLVLIEAGRPCQN